MEEPAVICGVCHDGEVNDPWVDWCEVCERKLCDDCIAATNEEHGCRFCCECVDAGLVEIEDGPEDQEEN